MRPKLLLLGFAGIFIFGFIVSAMAVSESTIKAADFTLPSLTGENISLSTYLGKKVILLVFGATWCPYCVKEIPELKEIDTAFKNKDFILLYIDIGESKKKVEAFAQEKALPYTVLLDEKSEVAQTYKVYGIPTGFLIDLKGKIAFKGGAPHGVLSQKIEELLKK